MSVPSFTILDDQFQFEQQQQAQRPMWETQYASNVISAPQNDPFAGYDVPNNAPNINYDSLSVPTRTPSVSASYDDMLRQNRYAGFNQQQWGMQSAGPAVLPEELRLPQVIPPYGTAYPTNGYSAFDGEMALGSGINSAYGMPGVPAASWPALEDARASPSVPLGPNHLYMVAEKHFKEGYKTGREEYVQSYSASCKDAVDHVASCPICSGYLNGDRKIMWIVIGILVIICLILAWFLFKKMTGGRRGGGQRRSQSAQPEQSAQDEEDAY